MKTSRRFSSHVMGRPHLLVVPLPAQGHVLPLMELSQNLVARGFQITFVNAESTHKRVVAALSKTGACEEFIHLVSIPEGMEVQDRRAQHAKLLDIMATVMPPHLENLIRKIGESNNGEDKITCVIADEHAGWALEVAAKMDIPRAAFWPACSVLLALKLHIPKLIEDGIITEDGDLIKHQMVQLSPTMPPMKTSHFGWLCLGNPVSRKAIFNMMVRNNRTVKFADYFICNSFYDLEPAVFDLIPNLKPIGPLFASSRLAHFWPEEPTCLNWLDEQLPNSVIYVAFGSSVVMDKQQFDELAHGLELTGKPFLWVVRPDFIVPNEVTGTAGTYPVGFEERVGSRGRIVGWCPQREVLAHSSVACFFTHCGWNSTMEGISHGAPLVCWPFYYDQFLNRSYICDVWKNGVELEPDESGSISRKEIKAKLIRVLEDEGIKANATKLKEMAVNNVSPGGISFRNFEDFVQAIK